MNVEPKRWNRGTDDDRIRSVVPGPDRGSLWVECEVTSPLGSKGRTVHVYLDPDAVELLLKELRTAAIRRRQLRDETPAEEAARWKQAGIEARARGKMRP